MYITFVIWPKCEMTLSKCCITLKQRGCCCYCCCCCCDMSFETHCERESGVSSHIRVHSYMHPSNCTYDFSVCVTLFSASAFCPCRVLFVVFLLLLRIIIIIIIIITIIIIQCLRDTTLYCWFRMCKVGVFLLCFFLSLSFSR